MPPTERTCKDCGHTGPLADFYFHKQSRCHMRRCIVCQMKRNVAKALASRKRAKSPPAAKRPAHNPDAALPVLLPSKRWQGRTGKPLRTVRARGVWDA